MSRSLTILILIFTLSCGKDFGDEGKFERAQQETDQETEGTYEAGLIPVNEARAGSTVGRFYVSIQGDEVSVRGDVENAGQSSHRQYIHSGRECPGPLADRNRDGEISSSESFPHTKGALISLGSSVPSSSRNYSTRRSWSLTRLLADLHSADPDPEAFMTKLSPGEELNLAGRAVMIYRVEGNGILPVACGIFIRTSGP